MKNIKKLLLLLLICSFVLPLTACGNKNVEGILGEIMTKIYEDIPTDELPMLSTFNVLEMQPDNIEYYIGTKDIEYEDIAVSEPMISSIAYSVVLVRMKDGADIEAAKTKIKESVNPAKWVCVEVQKEDVIVKSKGDLIILIMIDDKDTRKKIEKGFNNL